jgi:4'-phosphopantetheinyl transferase
MVLNKYMPVISPSNLIRCYFDHKPGPSPKSGKSRVDVYYAETKDLSKSYSYLKNYISPDEQVRADRFHFEKDRETYITCHSILRLVLSKYLNKNPLEITFNSGINQKPAINGDPVFFNIAHSRETFAIAVSGDFYVGIDLELINQDLDIKPITKSFFSTKEQQYIFKTDKGTKNRFFLLWTRKEALLKALGTGIIDDLRKIEVSGQDNFMSKKSFNYLPSDFALSNLYLYSKKIRNNYLSIAVPQKALIDLHDLDSDNIDSFLD